MKMFNIENRSRRQLSVFLGSPGDVAEERNAAREVVAELREHPLLHRRISIELVAWTRDSPMEGNADPQQAVAKYVGQPSACDLTVILVSGRLGTPFGRRKPDGSYYRSGTEWEFEDARQANKPTFLYVRRNPPEPRSDDERTQRRALSDFLAALDEAHLARNDYDSITELRLMLREHMLRFVSRHMDRVERASRVRLAAVASVIAMAIATALIIGMPRHPILRITSVAEGFLTSTLDEPDVPQQVRLVLIKSVVDGKQGDECLVQVSESESFTGAHGDVLEGTSSIVEDGVSCERDKSNFLFQLANRPHLESWRGWVRVALRRGNRIFESEPVAVVATIAPRSATR